MDTDKKAHADHIVAIACDHGGYDLKQILCNDLAALGLQVLDLGTNSDESVDYPLFGQKLAQAIADGRAARGVLICGSGIGISIAANRFAHIRAALCHNVEMAKLARQHNDANVIAFGARTMDQTSVRAALKVFLTTEFDGGRHARRVEQLSQALPANHSSN